MISAAYARYSSDAQREASIHDQLRNILGYCQRTGWPKPRVFTDEAMSGSRSDRPGYCSLIEAAKRREFSVLFVDDLSRLSRDHIECARALRILKFHGVRVIGVSDGVDTDRTGAKLETGLRGLMAEMYLDELAAKTHRGLTGLALAGYSAGGLPFGYRSIQDGQGRKRQIYEPEAETVRWVFEQYVNGHTPRTIAAELNARGVPSSRGKTWALSAIYPDRKHVGMLGNPIYISRQIWNRSQWVKDPFTGRRKRIERPESDWIVTEHSDLAILTSDVWQAAEERTRKTRQRTAQQRTSNPIASGGKGPKYLFSGLLTCGDCGGPMVIVDRYRYGCGTNKDRGSAACPSRIKVPRETIERVLLEGIKRDILSADAFKEFERETRRLLRETSPDPTTQRRALTQAKAELDNILAAIRAGILTASTKAALEEAEVRVEIAQRDLAAAESFQPTEFLPRARETFRDMVEKLESIEDVPAARESIRGIFGGPLRIVAEGEDIYAETAANDCQITVVAGAGFTIKSKLVPL